MDLPLLKLLSLFSGGDGFALAAEEMGWEVIAHCENAFFPQLVIKSRWPNSTLHENIKTTDFTIYRGLIDIITGGFPCQPFSVAGKQEGIDDERFLWDEMYRAICEVRPRWVVAENVRGLITQSGGVVFEQVQVDLENAGYEVQAYLLPAAGVNAPHERYRVLIIGYCQHDGFHAAQSGGNDYQPSQPARPDTFGQPAGTGSIQPSTGFTENRNQDGRGSKLREEKSSIREFRDVSPGDNERLRTDNAKAEITTNSNGQRSGRKWANSNGQNDNEAIGANLSFQVEGLSEEQPAANGNSIGWRGQTDRNRESRVANQNSKGDYWANFPTQPPVYFGNDGLPYESLRQRIRSDSMGIISEEEIDQILSKAYSYWRKETIKIAGNAVVPQLILQVFKAIQQYEISYTQ